MFIKIRCCLLLVIMSIALVCAGCGENDPDLDPPKLFAQINESGTGTYTTGNENETVKISGKVQVGYKELEFEATTPDTDTAATVAPPILDVGTSWVEWNTEVSNLQEGYNFIVVSASDKVGNQTQVSLLIILDKTPPTINVQQVVTPTPYNSQTIAGTVEANAEITVTYNSAPVTVSYNVLDGLILWQSDLTGLSPAYNVVKIGATDQYGNSENYNSIIMVNPASPVLTIKPTKIFNSATYNSVTLSGSKAANVSESDIILVLVSPAGAISVPEVFNSTTDLKVWEADIAPLSAGMTLATVTYNSTLSYNSTIAPTAKAQIYYDGNGPYLSESFPYSGSVAAEYNTAITFRFNEPIQIHNSATIAAGLADLFSVTEMGGSGTDIVTSNSLTYNSTTLTATFDPPADLALATTYNVTLLSYNSTYRILDLMGNDMTTEVNWKFTTAEQ